MSSAARLPVRAVAGRLRRDVTLTAVHAGLRAATGTAAPLALAYATGVRGYVLAAVGGWLTAMADVGGVTRTRGRVMGAYVALGGIAYAAGARTAGVAADLRSAGAAWLAVLVVSALVFCWSAAGALLRTLGDAGSTLGVLVAVTFIAALANPAPHAREALAGGAMIAGGGLWTMLLALGVWPVRPYSAARHAVADAYHELAHFAGGIAAAVSAGAGPEAGGRMEAAVARYTALAQHEHPRVRAALETGRSVLLATRRGRLGAAPRGDDLALLLDGADLVLVTLLTLAEAAEVVATARARDAGRAVTDDVAALGAVIARAAAALDELATAIVPGPRAGRRPDALAALEQDVVRLAVRLDASSVGGEACAPRARAEVRHATALVEALAGEVERGAETAAALASGGDDTLLAAVRAAVRRAGDGRDRPRRAGRPRRALARMLGEVDSPTLRHALRLGTAAAVAHALGAGLHIARGPWLTVTTLIVLQPSAGLTLRRSTARIVGTVAGGVVAAVLAAVLRDPRLIAAVVFPLAAAAVALRAVHYGVFTFFLTPVFVLIAQPAPGDWALAGVRAADTALGGLVAVAASLVLWPTWEAASLPGTLAAAVEAARAHAALAVRRACALDDGAPDVPRPEAVAAARRRAGLAATAGEDALGRFMAEPGGRGPGAEATLALLARVRRVNSAATALATFAPAPSAGGAARLAALGGDVDAVLATAAAAVRTERAPGAVPDALAALLGDAASGSRAAHETAERRVPEVPAWGTLVRVARHALGVRAAAARLAPPDDGRTSYATTFSGSGP